MSITRRGFLIGLPLIAAGCTVIGPDSFRSYYGAIPDEPFPISALNPTQVKPELRRTVVDYDASYAPGTVIVDTPERRLYYVLERGRAMRYAVGVGRAGLALRGNAVVGRKAQWPSWRPTDNMMARDPINRQFASGVPGGLNNPLGARALYLYRGGRDTMFRIHGTNQPHTIGLAMSSGCIRMLNHDVIDLYERVPVGARVVVKQA
jgi:lipoprotein-anchoring transpeptidase ErfK/SrfK